MQSEALMFIGIIVAITLVLMVFRVPAYVAIFSLIVGFVLNAQVSGDVYGFMSGIFGFLSYDTMQTIILILPFILTVMFTKGKSSGAKLIFDFIPSVLAALAFAAITYPKIGIIRDAADTATNTQFDEFRSTVIVLASVVGLVSLWLSFPKHHKKRSKHHK